MISLRLMGSGKWGLDVTAIAEHGFMMHGGGDPIANHALFLNPEFLCRMGDGIDREGGWVR